MVVVVVGGGGAINEKQQSSEPLEVVDFALGDSQHSAWHRVMIPEALRLSPLTRSSARASKWEIKRGPTRKNDRFAAHPLDFRPGCNERPLQ